MVVLRRFFSSSDDDDDDELPPSLRARFVFFLSLSRFFFFSFPDGFKFAPPDPNASAASKRALAQKMDAIDERFAAVRREIEVQYGLR